MTERSYFVYFHRRKDTGEVFYVGKGTRTNKKQYERAYTADNRSKFWLRIVGKCGGYDVVIVADYFSETDAFSLERNLIAKHGRRIDGGTLCNLTLGGEGHSGLSPNNETRSKLRAAVSGEKHPNYGKRLSVETCRRKSEALKSSDKNLRGKKLPQQWKDRIAAGKIGALNPMYGRCGAAHPNSRKVVERATGAAYDSVQIAAEACGLKMKTLYNWLSGHRHNPTTLELA